jgi:hypothetical protein
MTEEEVSQLFADMVCFNYTQDEIEALEALADFYNGSDCQ